MCTFEEESCNRDDGKMDPANFLAAAVADAHAFRRDDNNNNCKYQKELLPAMRAGDAYS